MVAGPGAACAPDLLGRTPSPVTGFRLIILAAVVVAAAVSVPEIAPGLLARLVETPASERAEASPPRRPAAPASKPVAATARERAARSSSSATGRRVVLEADRGGHFLVDASINGRRIEALVDTGATTVSLTAETARRLGIYPPRSAFNLPTSTANGIVNVARVTLSEVRVGGIRVRNVEATVSPGDQLRVNLLGMSFLGRLSKFELSGPRLVLLE